jgi:hypothetical protein
MRAVLSRKQKGDRALMTFFLLIDKGVYPAGHAELEHRFKGGAGHEYGTGDQADRPEVEQPGGCQYTAEQKSYLGGEDLGTGVHHGRFDVESGNDCFADVGEQAVLWIEKASNEEVGGDNQDDPFPRSEEKEHNGDKSESGVDPNSVLVDQFKGYGAHQIHGKLLGFGKGRAMLYF